MCRNSRGEETSIIAIVKTQGSDTKLVTQIADGENGGVMMNEFPPKYLDVMRECSGSDVPTLNVTEYLEHLAANGIQEKDFPPLQPLFQRRIWDRFQPGGGPEKMAGIIEQLKKENNRFHMEGGSWTNNISWVRGYEKLLGPMEKASSFFYEKAIQP